MNVPYLQHHYGQFTPQNHGLRHPSIAPYGAFTCGDGKQVLLSIQNEREWYRLCEIVLGDSTIAARDAFASNTLRVSHRDELEQMISEIFNDHSREAVIKKLETAEIAYGRVSDLDDLVAHPQNRYREISTSNGAVKVLGRGAEIAGKVDKTLSLPAIGQDSEKIRKEFSK